MKGVNLQADRNVLTLRLFCVKPVTKSWTTLRFWDEAAAEIVLSTLMQCILRINVKNQVYTQVNGDTSKTAKIIKR